ncbi:hypothetical protein DPX16_15188 [Anabarilius grahami]|uniref:Uncharacterized protein n=1 Tax=Anabarilius grahami TaxID=495550 RepID=A0A3N0YVB3_ANAGA|nr:hypothetical protein DPX16_15188 [Anabarilius grahami]
MCMKIFVFSGLLCASERLLKELKVEQSGEEIAAGRQTERRRGDERREDERRGEDDERRGEDEERRGEIQEEK